MLIEQGIARAGLIGPARSLLVNGPRFLEEMVPRLKSDPNFLVSGRGVEHNSAVPDELRSSNALTGRDCQISTTL